MIDDISILYDYVLKFCMIDGLIAFCLCVCMFAV